MKSSRKPESECTEEFKDDIFINALGKIPKVVVDVRIEELLAVANLPNITREQPKSANKVTPPNFHQQNPAPNFLTPHERVGSNVLLYCSELPKESVAEGVVLSMDPKEEIDNVVLGPGFVKVVIKRAIEPNYYLLRPRKGVNTVGQVVGKVVAWQIDNEKPNEIELGCKHTIKSHGTKLARGHKHDWLILILLAIIEIVLNIIHPFYRYVGVQMMTDLRYPMKENTVPVWAVPIYAVLLPIFIFVLYYLRRRDVYDLHHSILGLLFAVLITGVLTDSIKNAVGRPRPNFFWRCFPDGQDRYDNWGNVVCHGKESEIKEGHKSFPSGHTSWSFAGLGFLALYLSGKIKCFDGKGHVAKLCILFLPILAASLVGVSRVDDYWHHWQDVFAGGILGI
ncbi:hypothetical protein RD792_011421 [Penstemon davidsonii]|uniref:Phosphatidic acid phosphatase type 2/haloperoxidase domain-containing protein n=1 Tax=Penstemon davidsonii TaxID=160366 RepID=A0ABR0D5B0_9LAMI|nr:hypothetical protein RD792_011421 [Penstemon davidsonii]